MAERKTNETLEQQRKARQEFLELKKMQHGEMDTGPKPSEVAIVPKTPKEKLKNIWFHDKGFILGALALVIVISIMVAQCASKEKYDLEVVVYTYQPIMDENTALMENYFEQYCEDLDGNGEVNVQVINCSFNADSGDVQYRNTMSMKLQAIIASDVRALLFVTDKDSLEYLNGLSDDGGIFEDEPLVLGEAFYEASSSEKDIINLPEELMLSCRKVSGTMLEKDEEVEKYFECSKKIIENIKNDK